jgi:hypothetical protein
MSLSDQDLFQILKSKALNYKKKKKKKKKDSVMTYIPRRKVDLPPQHVMSNTGH